LPPVPPCPHDGARLGPDRPPRLPRRAPRPRRLRRRPRPGRARRRADLLLADGLHRHRRGAPAHGDRAATEGVSMLERLRHRLFHRNTLWASCLLCIGSLPDSWDGIWPPLERRLPPPPPPP